MAKIRLAVLFGGRACEHDVSIISAVQCMAQIDRETYEVIPVYIARDGAWHTGAPLLDIAFFRDFRPDAAGLTRVYPDVTAGSGVLLAIDRKKGLFAKDALTVAARADVWMPVLHGTNGEDGAVQGLLELMNVPYTSCGPAASSVGMDKIMMKQAFRGCGFPVVEDCWFLREQWERDGEAVVRRVEETLPYPVFVKPANLGSSIGIAKATDRDTLRAAVEVALAYDRRILVERGIDKPVEVNCAVMGFGEDVTASVCEMPLTGEDFLSFLEKYLRNRKAAKAGGMETMSRKIPAPIGPEMTACVRKLSADIFRALDCKGVVRIDFMLEGDALYVGEINTIPGSLAFYLWERTGLPYPALVDRLVELAFRAHAEKARAVFAFDSEILRQVTLHGAKGAKN